MARRSDSEGNYIRVRKPNIPKLEFSKIIISLVMITYFLGIYIGYKIMFTVLLEFPDIIVQALIAYFTYIGAPISAALSFYLWKAKNENVEKISKMYGGEDNES